MTLSITLASKQNPAKYLFPLDGEAPPTVLNLGHSLWWEATVTDIGGVPARFAYATLSSGGKIVDLPARVEFSIGTACDTGKEVYGDEAVWGHLYVDDEEDLLNLYIHVSAQMFKRLAHFCELGAQPAVTAELRDNEVLETSGVDGRLESWDDVRVRRLIVDWCYFSTTLPHVGREIS